MPRAAWRACSPASTADAPGPGRRRQARRRAAANPLAPATGVIWRRPSYPPGRRAAAHVVHLRRDDGTGGSSSPRRATRFEPRTSERCRDDQADASRLQARPPAGGKNRDGTVRRGSAVLMHVATGKNLGKGWRPAARRAWWRGRSAGASVGAAKPVQIRNAWECNRCAGRARTQGTTVRSSRQRGLRRTASIDAHAGFVDLGTSKFAWRTAAETGVADGTRWFDPG